MVLHIDSITRTSSIVPFENPIRLTISYSGGAGTTSLLYGGTLATGGSSGTFTDITIPIDWVALTLSAGLTLATAAIGISDGTTTDQVTLRFFNFTTLIFAELVSPTTYAPSTYDFTQVYDDRFGIGGGPVVSGSPTVSVPYDNWFLFGFPETRSLTRDANQDFFDLGVPFSSLEWHFGDGGTSTDDAPTHIFSSAGTYTVSLIADYAPFYVAALIFTTYPLPLVTGQTKVQGSTFVVVDELVIEPPPLETRGLSLVVFGGLEILEPFKIPIDGGEISIQAVGMTPALSVSPGESSGGAGALLSGTGFFPGATIASFEMSGEFGTITFYDPDTFATVAVTVESDGSWTGHFFVPFPSGFDPVSVTLTATDSHGSTASIGFIVDPTFG